MTLLDRYSQIGLTCFTDELRVIRAAVRQQLAKWEVRALETEGDVDLTQIYSVAPRPGGRHPKKAVFFCPKSHPGSTVMFANYADGWQSLAVCVSKHVSGKVFRLAVGSEREEWPLYLFEVVEGGRERRHVSVVKDVDRWKFWQTGDPLPEEEVTVYRKRRIIDRLSRQYLVSLAERLGFPIDDDRFWESDMMAVYFEEQRPET